MDVRLIIIVEQHAIEPFMLSQFSGNLLNKLKDEEKNKPWVFCFVFGLSQK